MPPVKCSVVYCKNKPIMKRPKTGDFMCKECFFYCFEEEIHFTIRVNNLFKRGDKIAIGASGGKDSTVLAHTLKTINDRFDYGWDLFLLSIDEGIAGYRDDSLETVKQNKEDYQLPLKILSYKDLYGWTMDEIVAQIGKKNNCTFCGVFRRQALDRGAALIGANIIATGHNADDMAETVLMNIFRGDIARLSRCTNIVTEGEGTIPRCKPLKWCYEKEIVLYAHYKNLVYFSTECTYAPNAYRGHTREFLKDLERIKPSCILDIIHSGETMKFKDTVKFPARRYCTRCGFVASQEICKACVLLEGLNTGNPRLGITKSNKAKRAMGIKVEDGSENKGRRKKEEKDPNFLSKRKMKRELRKERRGQAPCEDESSSTCKTEAEASKKETAKVTASELIPEGTSDDLSDLVLPLALYSSDEDSDNAKEKKEEKIPSQNQRKSTCGDGCGSGCGPKISKPTTSSLNKGKACGQGCGSSCRSKTSKSRSNFKQGCGGDDFTLSVDLSDDEEADHTEKKKDESSSRRESTAGGSYRYFTKNGEPGIPLNELFNPKYLEEALQEAMKDLEEFRSGNYTVPENTGSSSEEEFVIDATEKMNEFKNNDIECDCPECQGDDKIGSGFINMELYKKLMDMKPVPEKDRLNIKINGKFVDLDSFLDGPIETIIVEDEDDSKKRKKPSTSANKSNQPAASSSTDTASDEQPTVVKANPVKKGPSILLPEMMHKTPNQLDF